MAVVTVIARNGFEALRKHEGMIARAAEYSAPLVPCKFYVFESVLDALNHPSTPRRHESA